MSKFYLLSFLLSKNSFQVEAILSPPPTNQGTWRYCGHDTAVFG